MRRAIRAGFGGTTLSMLLCVQTAGASECVDLGLHARAQGADAIVVARVIDPERWTFEVERVLKRNPPTAGASRAQPR